jgi:hypothetical protein
MKNNEKVGLKIVELIHDITQNGYEVKFCSDFQGMVRIDYTKEWDNTFYHHEHRGYPSGISNQLEKEIIASLSTFLDNIKE